jgi:hypothetical protein
MKKILKGTTGLIMILGISGGVANASLSSVDWNNQGDGLLTYDNQTGLAWLDLTVTDNISYNQVQNRLSSDLSGFRYGTIAEVATLMQHAGIEYFNNTTEYGKQSLFPKVATFYNLLGKTNEEQYRSTAFGFVDQGYGSYHYIAGVLTSGDDGAYLVVDRITQGWYELADAQPYSEVGSFLVKNYTPPSPVPVPSTVLLLGSGLVGLAAIGKRHSR